MNNIKRATLISLLVSATLVGVFAVDTIQSFEMVEVTDAVAVQGVNVTMRCLLIPGTVKCLWVIKGIIAVPDQSHLLYDKSPQDGDCSLLIVSVNLNDDGSYQCQSRADGDNATTTSKIATLTVLNKPQLPVISYKGINQSPGQIIVPPATEENFTMSCYSKSGNPAAILRWFTEKYEPEAHVEYIQEGLGPLKTTNSTLSLTRSTALAMRKLHCSAEHPTFDKVEEIFVLFSPGSPVTSVKSRFVDTVETTILSAVGVNVSVECTADGEPIPAFRWEMLEGGIPTWAHYKYGANISVLTAPGAISYRCMARNELNTAYIFSSEIIITSSAFRIAAGKMDGMFGLSMMFSVLMFLWK